ncbi:PREDICTED: uncharacterized protein LOC108764663, partial [Trachymyrmex cornetzi]|uniref:uncharacterized protein LOC108764663 n=1 Tax=Trachymyrmex cornetzi TaxID=471704 RepID=UPI00084F7686
LLHTLAELRNLKVKRGQFKVQLTRFSNVLETREADDQEISERLNKLTEIWDKFHNIQYAIKETRAQGLSGEEEQAQLEQIEQEENNEEIEFEDNYFKLVARAKRRIAQSNPGNNSAMVAAAGRNLTVKSSVKLPTITLPTFNGQYSKWMQFKDAFLSLIDKDTTLSEVQKLQYLRGTLKDEALQFIGLETTAENYRTAWELLDNHYEN